MNLIDFKQTGESHFAETFISGLGDMKAGRRQAFIKLQFGRIPTGEWIARAQPVGLLGQEIRKLGLLNESDARAAAIACGRELVQQLTELTRIVAKTGEQITPGKWTGRDSKGFQVEVTV